MSQRFTLNREDLKKIATGALMAVLGALLTYITSVIGDIDFGSYTPLVVSIWSVIANIIRKWISE